jgi:hypothetical protein
MVIGVPPVLGQLVGHGRAAPEAVVNVETAGTGGFQTQLMIDIPVPQNAKH